MAGRGGRERMCTTACEALKLDSCWAFPFLIKARDTRELRICIPCLIADDEPESPVSTLVKWSRWRADLGRHREADAAARTFRTSATALAFVVPSAEC